MNEPKDCPDCQSLMHRCAPHKLGVGTERSTGCSANGLHHPKGEWWVCMFCGRKEADRVEAV